MKHWISIIVSLGILGNPAIQQGSFGCPKDWVLFQANCYMFSKDDLVYDEAEAVCWTKGARLVSVETNQEHSFISSHLKVIAYGRATYWYTSGKYDGNGDPSTSGVYWDGIQQRHAQSEHWVSDPPHVRNSITVYRIAYVFTGEEYRWTNITKSYVGSYICEIARADIDAYNFMERDFEYGNPHIEPSKIEKGPVIIKQPESVIVFETVRIAEIECLAIGNPVPTFTFWKGANMTDAQEVLPNPSVTLTSGKMTIEDPEETDHGGSYYCTAENKVGTVISQTARLIFGYLGHFSNIELEPVQAQAFRGTKLECHEPSYSPRVTFMWFKNSATGIHVWEGALNLFVSNSGALYFSEVQPTDADKKYFCVVTLAATEGDTLGAGNLPSRASLGQWLRLADDSFATDNDYGPILYTHVFPSNTMVGQRVRMECIAYGTLPLTYSWYREDGRKFVTGTEAIDRGRVLIIKKATLEAEGNYVCKCVRGTGQSATKTVVLTIHAKPFFPVSIGNKFADSGMTLRWYCKAVARPSAFYSWYKDGKLLTNVPSHISIFGGMLMIQNVDESRDEGMYQCAATNTYGTTFSSGQLKVLSFKPTFDGNPLPPTTFGAQGGNQTIPCRVEAAPIPQVTWLKNGVDLNLMPGDMSSRIGMDSFFSLWITDIVLSDQAIYTCKAFNPEGEASNFTRLIVIEGITMLIPPRPTIVTVNQTAFMYCEASYNHNYDIAHVWKLNGNEIDVQLSPEYHVTDKGLYIRPVRFKHAGVYECELRTPLHSLSASAILTVQGPPFPPAGVYVDINSVTPRSVRLIWTAVIPSRYRSSDVTSYDIEAETHYVKDQWKVITSDVSEITASNEGKEFGVRQDQRAYTVTGLIPNTNYRFRIRAINQFGRGEEASKPTSSVKLSATKPVLAPSYVGGGGGKVGTLTISWTPLEESEYCGPDFGYYVYWKKPQDTRDWKRETASDSKALEDGTYIVTVGVENYYLPYQVKVGVFNRLGHGPNSTVATIFSAEGMPQVVPVATQTDTYNGTSVIVYWIPVEDTRESVMGRVAGYRVYYYANMFDESPFDNGEPDPVKNEILFKDVYGQTDHCQLIGLHANAEYFTRVQVFNGAGFGPKGEWRRTETANYLLSEFPVNVAVYHHGPHSIKVTWRGVNTHPLQESVKGYIIRIWKLQEDIRTANDTLVEKVNQAVVNGLQNNQIYVLRVLGYSKAGNGSLSRSVLFTITDGRNVKYVIDPTTSEICFSSEYLRTCRGSTTRTTMLAMCAIFLHILLHILI